MEQYILITIGLCMLMLGVYRKVRSRRTHTPRPTMKVVCAWCGIHMSGDVYADVISHGICPLCRDKVMGTPSKGRRSMDKQYTHGRDAWSGIPQDDKVWHNQSMSERQ